MSTQESLSGFFDRTDPATLDSCDLEQIHLSGHIQNLGALLVVDPVTQAILGASENAGAFLGIDQEKLMQETLLDVSEELSASVSELKDDNFVLHEVLEFAITHDGVAHDTVVHTHDGRRIIEFVPNSEPSATSFRIKMRQCSKACGRILYSESWQEAMDIAAASVSEIIGFSRVMIYQFQEDGSGAVLAENLTEDVPPFLGLHFPAYDIPKQAREVMKLLPYRAVATNQDNVIPIRTAPGVSGSLDLTRSVLRSVSTMHTAYLRNMKSEATFSCSLMHKGELWGLISAHHSQPGLLPFDSWNLIHEISGALMMRFAEKQRTETSKMITELRKIESGFSAALRHGGDIEDILSDMVPVLQEFLGADGFAFQYGTNLHVSGKTPPNDFIRELVKWTMSKSGAEDQFKSISLHQEWPEAVKHIDTACGVLVQPIMMHRICQLVWFRAPIVQKVRWAGRPESSKEHTLGPRNSFDTWVAEHRDKSATWQEAELESAREIFQEFLDILTSQILLREENASLRIFASTAAHDLRAPLRNIDMALNWMSEDGFAEDAIRKTHAIALASTRRMSDLAEGLLELAVIQDQKHEFEKVDLTRTIADVKDLLSPQLIEANATLEVGKIISIDGNRNLLLRLLMNIISNCIKYRHSQRPLNIHISSKAKAPNALEITISDNGVGVPEKFADRIFLPMERLFSKDEIEGTGLGLTICQRIVELHNGSIHLDASKVEGASVVISLPLRQDAAA